MQIFVSNGGIISQNFFEYIFQQIFIYLFFIIFFYTCFVQLRSHMHGFNQISVRQEEVAFLIENRTMSLKRKIVFKM